MDSDSDNFSMLVEGGPYEQHDDDTEAKDKKSMCRRVSVFKHFLNLFVVNFILTHMYVHVNLIFYTRFFSSILKYMRFTALYSAACLTPTVVHFTLDIENPQKLLIFTHRQGVDYKGCISTEHLKPAEYLKVTGWDQPPDDNLTTNIPQTIQNCQAMNLFSLSAECLDDFIETTESQYNYFSA